MMLTYLLYNMEANYIILLDFSTAELIKIKLTDEEIESSYLYDSFENFLYTLEEKYQFHVQDCYWMICENLSEQSYLN